MTKEEMISLLKTDLNNEWNHLMFYLYHSSSITGLHREEYKELLLNAANSEMSHVKEFQDVILGLGGEIIQPVADFPCFTSPCQIMNYALTMEETVVKNYTERIEQAVQLGGVDGKWLEIFLEDQLKDSRKDVDNLRRVTNFKVDQCQQKTNGNS